MRKTRNEDGPKPALRAAGQYMLGEDVNQATSFVLLTAPSPTSFSLMKP